ncbi:hypothetical protein ZIOFF_065047 [Zingiber officinale]|uniref:DNA-(apurinic or apyrimidinic site) endonuclease n=1 Tax=Zingiber officinale TaxID=94328 RepID=A0A8J5KCX9_ZINOF|nr:hypothetical protein ZIOFF_065047 [Zingiber officinale]
MKRFFQPIVKEGSSKKPALSTSADTPLCPAADGGDKKEEKRGSTPPLKFLTWNANSLLLRVKNNWPEFSRLVQSLDPDVICFQVLMRALSNPPFREYHVWWSLSDSKYGGTALLCKKQLEPKKDCGQPGFTLAERHRFDSILTQGKLIDAYRFLHKEKDMEGGFSWSGNPVGKYRGKRMRIDYFIVSEKLKDKIVACEMHGHGIELEGFCGSDHCPVSLVLSDEAWRS